VIRVGDVLLVLAFSLAAVPDWLMVALAVGLFAALTVTVWALAGGGRG
jgi:hypothetical protein